MRDRSLTKTAGHLLMSLIGEQLSGRLSATLMLSAQRGKKLYVDSQLQRNQLLGARIATHMTRNELCALYELASICPPGATAMEIGSYHGASTCYLGTGIKQIGGRLICVDTWENETMPEGPQDTFSLFEKNTAGLQEVISVRRKRSEDLAKVDIPSQLDLVFIDGDHSYGAVRADVNTVSPALIDEGILAFHDVKWFQGVSRVVGELLSTGSWTFVASVDNLIWLKKSRPNYSEPLDISAPIE
jgi:predicted O-methyltransferase YrrM